MEGLRLRGLAYSVRAAALEALGLCFFSQELQIFASVYNRKGKSMIGYEFYSTFYTYIKLFDV
jgi:hypothetical protein